MDFRDTAVASPGDGGDPEVRSLKRDLDLAAGRLAEIDAQFQDIPEAHRNSAAAARIRSERDAAFAAARNAEAEYQRADFARQVALRSPDYAALPSRLASEVQSWQPPPHPRPDAALAAEESPQLANGLLELRLINKPLVKTPGMWDRDHRAAEAVRRLQAERKAAEQRGPADLAAFDSVLPLASEVDTNVSDTWTPGMEEWGLVNKGLSLPAAFGSLFTGMGEQFAGQMLASAGVPNKAWDERAVTESQVINAADDLMGNIPSGMYYMATGDKRRAPGYAKAYWSEVKRRESEPLYQMRPAMSVPAPPHRSYDTGARAMEYTEDMLRGTGLSDAAKLGLGFSAAVLAGSGTDVFMPYQAARGLGDASRMAAKDLAYGGGIQGALLGAQMMPPDYREAKRQAVDDQYSQMIRSLLSENRIAK